MTTKPSSNAPADDDAEAGIVTRADLKAEEKPTGPPKTVKMTGPAGTKVETSEENADALREAGYS